MSQPLPTYELDESSNQQEDYGDFAQCTRVHVGEDLSDLIKTNLFPIENEGLLSSVSNYSLLTLLVRDDQSNLLSFEWSSSNIKKRWLLCIGVSAKNVMNFDKPTFIKGRTTDVQHSNIVKSASIVGALPNIHYLRSPILKIGT